MWLGFLNSGDNPPPPAMPEQNPDEPEDRSDDTGIRISSSLEAARLKYRKKGSKLSRYAWAISLSLHVVVIAGLYLAYRHYVRQSQSPPAPAGNVVDESGSIMRSADATDRVHANWSGLLVSPSGELSPYISGLSSNDDVPTLYLQDPQTLNALQNEPDIFPPFAVVGTPKTIEPPAHFPNHPPTLDPAATQPASSPPGSALR